MPQGCYIKGEAVDLQQALNKDGKMKCAPKMLHKRRGSFKKEIVYFDDYVKFQIFFKLPQSL